MRELSTQQQALWLFLYFNFNWNFKIVWSIYYNQ